MTINGCDGYSNCSTFDRADGRDLSIASTIHPSLLIFAYSFPNAVSTEFITWLRYPDRNPTTLLSTMIKQIARTSKALLAALALGTLLTLGCSDSTTNPTDPNADVTLAAPPAGEGLQVVIGPFDIPAGQEVQRNYYQKLPNDSDIYVTKIEIKYNTGSHHLNIFKNDSLLVADHMEESFNAIDFATWDMVAASQKGDLTWSLPPGVAIKLTARQQMNFQTHYVNAATQGTPTGRGKVIVNFWTTDKKNVTSIVGALFSNNRILKIPPHTSQTYGKVVKALGTDVNLLLMTGHFHSRGKAFTVGHWDGTKLTDTIYHSGNWDEPPVTHFSPVYTLAANDSLAYITTFENRTNAEIKFGGHVEIEEHANLFTFYYPAPPNGKAVYDFTGGFLMESHPLP